MPSLPVPLSQRALQTGEQPISYFMKQAVENPGLISLAAGLVDAGSLPADEVRQALEEILSRPESAQAALQYGTTQGHAPLRDLLLRRTTSLDNRTPAELNLTADDVVITTGSQQLLYLLGEVLLDPGDIVITEAPSYFVYQGTLVSLGVRTLAVPMDGEGMITAALEELLQRLERSGELDRVRMVYVVDYFQNPTGLTLSWPRRQHLLALVQRYSRQRRIILLEDAAYRELRYDGADIPTIKSLDVRNEHVALAMTFSKPCAPGLKTGYGLLPRDLVDPVLHFKGNHDFGSNNLTQHLLLRLLQNGAYERHVARLRDVYRHKRNTMLEALTDAFPVETGMRWTRPAGGLYVWARFPDGLNAGPGGPLMQAALEEGVLYVPGEFCYVNAGGVLEEKAPVNEARLSFGVASPEQLREGVRRLARALQRLHPSPRRVCPRGVSV